MTLLWIVAAIGIPVVSGIIYQAVATAKDNRKYPPPGQTVDAGGFRLHLNIAGVEHRDFGVIGSYLG